MTVSPITSSTTTTTTTAPSTTPSSSVDSSEGADGGSEEHTGQSSPVGEPKAGNTSGGSWNPANTRVFDVYMDKGSSQTSQLLDIFSCDEKNSENKRNANHQQEIELCNSGSGKKAHALTDEFFENIKNKRMKTGNKEPLPSLTLPIVKVEPRITYDQRVSSHPSNCGSLPNNSGALVNSFTNEQVSFGQTDKWPTPMETAFIAALRLIIKNGTSKFKILDKNYGRNELISLFVQYHTGEVRTKKQISSHIQVWKKSISNKISSNFEINSLDKEILQLIEGGAPQTNESVKIFYSSFEEIVSALSKKGKSSPKQLPNKDNLPHYPYLTPTNSATHMTPPYSSTNSFSSQQNEDSQRSTTPATPLDYAKSIYGSLKTYKCVPVKVQEQSLLQHGVQSLPQQRICTNSSQKEYPNPILQSAKDLEKQQRQLIENLSHTQNKLKLPSVSPNLFMRNVQHPLPPQQPHMYPPPSQGLPTGPIPHYPMTYHQYQTNVDHVPAGMVLPPHAYYPQPQIYVPISATPAPQSNCSNFQFARLPMNELQHPRIQTSSPSSSSSPPGGGPIVQARETRQLNETKP